jgi:hypothetical protein
MDRREKIKLDDKVFNCIKSLLEKNGFYIKTYNVEKGFDTITTIDLYSNFNEKEGVSLGFVEYSISNKDGGLLINHIDRYSKELLKFYTSKEDFITFSELMLYKLIIDNSNRVEYIYLIAVPEYKHPGKEFCLMCSYEKLGFTQYDIGEYKNALKYCKKELKILNKKNREELLIDLETKRDTCILCKCQKANINLEKFDLGFLSLEMKYAIDNIDITLEKICKKL